MKTFLKSYPISVIGTVLFTFLLVSLNTKAKKISKKQFAFIPSGFVKLGTDSFSVQSFYMSKYEVSNKEYRTFLNEIKKIDEALFKQCLPDTLKWLSKSSSMQAFKDYYFSHPAYEDYPVVNVSKKGAEEYCKWFTEKYNSNQKKGTKLIFRLPLEAEFVRATRGDQHQQIYAWKNNSIRNDNGQFMCNHVHIDASSTQQYNADNTDVTAPVKSYWPNTFGIYNLNGNVAEMINEKNVAMGGSWKHDSTNVTNESKMFFSEAQPYVGFRMVATFLR
jgi:sulfatase modifying factor 1